MDIQSIGLSIGQVITLASIFLWIVKSNSRKLEALTQKITQISTQIAIIETVIEYVKIDHDRVIRFEERMDKFKSDLDFAHNSLRKIQGGVK